MSDVVLERIAAWEAAGLIDAATAERLRAAEVAAGPARGCPPPASCRAVRGRVLVLRTRRHGRRDVLVPRQRIRARRLGLPASGGSRPKRPEPARSWLLVAGFAVPAAVFFLIGLVLHGRTARLSRAAGVAFLLSVGFVWSGVFLNVEIFADGAVVQVAAAASLPWSRRPPTAGSIRRC